MHDSTEHTVRAWVRQLEQKWNEGNLDSCVPKLDADVIVSMERQRTRVPRAVILRWLRFRLSYCSDYQATAVIESIDVLPASAVLTLRAHLRCQRGDQIEEQRIRMRFILRRSEPHDWDIQSIFF